MIIEVNGQQVEVDDSFASLPPEQQQAELAHITQATAPPKASVEVRGANPEDLIDTLKPTLAGVIAGEAAGPMINKGMQAARSAPPVAGMMPGAPGSANGAAPGQKYAAKTGYGSGPGYTTEEVIEHKKAQERPIGKGKISSNIARNSPMNLDKMMMLEAEQKAEAARRAAALSQGMTTGERIMSKMPGPVQAAGRFLGGATQAGVAPWLGRGIAGGGVGFQGADAYNRFKQGDYPGAAISTIGAIGAGSSLFPTPVTRLGGPVISVGAEALNAYLDRLKQKAEQPAPAPAPAQAPLSPQGAAPAQPAPQAMAKGGLATLAGGGKAEAAKKLFAPVATKILKASEALGPHEGKWLNVTQSDRMRSTMGDLGGPGFSKFQLERPEYAAAEAAWGVGKKPTASGIVNVNKRFPEGQAIWTPMIGGETQHHSNQHVYDALSDEFKRQARLGKLPKELQERMNARLASAPATKGMFPEQFDIGNPEHLSQYGDTFNRRGALSTVMSGEGVGGAKGRIIDYPGIMQEMTDPMTVGSPTHSLGTRLFTLNNEVEHRPDLHSAFPYILKGKDQGVAFAPVPKELGIQDFINQFKDFKGREPGYYDLVRTTPSQQVTEKYLRSLEEAGHKKGGKVKK